MVNVLADIALESEAATVSALRIARAFDSDDGDEAAFRRLALAVMKYWVCKRGAPLAAEALECLGGNGYVEEAPMAQFYRDIQIGTVWEGSGNVIALDVLRALAPRTRRARGVPGQCELAPGADPHFDAHLRCAARGPRRALPSDPARPNGALAGSSRTWRSRCRPACCCATRRRVSERSAPGAWAHAASPSAICRAASTARAIVERALAL
jgi:putative acyl-CoA dehydrogenase